MKRRPIQILLAFCIISLFAIATVNAEIVEIIENNVTDATIDGTPYTFRIINWFNNGANVLINGVSQYISAWTGIQTDYNDELSIFTNEYNKNDNMTLDVLPFFDTYGVCGNHINEFGEDCDEGSNNGNICTPPTEGSCEYCTTECTIATNSGSVCGDGTKEGVEECDDGNLNNGDGCSSTCTLEQTQECGNGIIEGIETCDAGEDNGVLCDPVYEDSCDYCTLTCEFDTVEGEFCGDEDINGPEECDDGSNNGNACTPAYADTCTYCTVSCTDNTLNGPSCGDSVTNGPEVCDDGNQDNTDVCLDTCEENVCGDGFLYSGVEQCDDGNLNDDDTCTATCDNNVCGDGFLNTGIEACDDGNNDDGDGCSAICVSELCGDGNLDPGEQCDDNNNIDGDGCSASCLITKQCNDGVDNDGDGTIDFPTDLGCSSANDNAEFLDSDFDTFEDDKDNCPTIQNQGQEDDDNDTVGNACDNCVLILNPDQTNSDADAFGDACDVCPTVDDPGQEDGDNDSVGDACDLCPAIFDPDQEDLDGDLEGDACDADIDGDGLLNEDDNLMGDGSHIASNLDALTLIINGTSDTNQTFNGTNTLELFNNGSALMSFVYNFTNSSLDLSGVTIDYQEDPSSIVINGLDLGGTTKTVWIPRSSSVSAVCVRDLDDVSLEQVSVGCSQLGETFVLCDGLLHNGYICSIEDNETTLKISGLSHSAVKQQCQDADGDGYGNLCLLGNDCNDGDASFHPGAEEICGDGLDNDCNGEADESCAAVQTSSGGGGGGGGGSSGSIIIGSSISYGWSQISADNWLEFNVNDVNIPIIMVRVKVNKALDQVDMEVGELASQPADTETAPGLVYHYLQIETTGLPDDAIGQAQFRFAVPFDWMKENDLSASDIVAYRWNDGAWHALATKELTYDDTSTIFEVSLPGFSYFAIAVPSGEEVPVEEIMEEETTDDDPQVVEGDSTPVFQEREDGGAGLDDITGHAVEDQEAGNSGFILTLVVLALGLSLLGMFLYQEYGPKKGNPKGKK